MLQPGAMFTRYANLATLDFIHGFTQFDSDKR